MNLGNFTKLSYLEINSTGITSFPESMKNLKGIKRIMGNLNKDNGAWGIPPSEKEKLVQWFPDAKIYIW